MRRLLQRRDKMGLEDWDGEVFKGKNLASDPIEMRDGGKDREISSSTAAVAASVSSVLSLPSQRKGGKVLRFAVRCGRSGFEGKKEKETRW